ncbi:MAG: sensor histidine kinase [Planctomycetota bacterium]|jgi:two-component system phosphate regulon sensor histidine kinase PhoR
MPRKRLLWQLYPSYLLLTVIAVLAAAWYTSHSLRTFHFHQVSEGIKARAHLIAQQIANDLAGGDLEKIDRFCKTTGPLSATRITVILPDGRVIGDSDEQIADMNNHADRPEFRDAIATGLGRSERPSDTLGQNMMYLAIPIQSRDSHGAGTPPIEPDKILAVVRTSVPVSAIDDQLRKIYLKIFGIILIVAILAAVVGVHQSKRIKQLEAIRRDFVANVSHELKTPITSIKGFVETLQEGALTDPEQADRFLEIIARHADRLNAIIDDLLSLSRLEEDSEQRALSFEMTLLKPVLTEAIALSKPAAEAKRIRIDLNCSETLAARMNPALLEQAVTNLINNAIKYSTEESRIEITAEQTGDEMRLAVRDQGCGIAEKYHERIFQRFYVVDKSRSRKLGGTGLGLAIVKHIAQVHNGTVTLESQPGSGSTFTLHLP